MKAKQKPLRIQEIQALRREYRMAEIRMKNLGLKNKVQPWTRYLQTMAKMKTQDPQSFKKIISGDFRNELN